MRRQNCFNNRKIRRQAKKVICIATLTATMLTSIPFVSYTDAYAKGQTTLEEMKTLSMPTKNAITYNLSDASLITDKTIVDYFGRETTVKVIEINITKNGNYIIKGSNEINDALIDTHIVVAEGVEANIIFDGATIKNDSLYGNDLGGCGTISYSPLFPVLDIEGTANLYVQEDSSLTSAAATENPVICVTGQMTLKEGTGSLKLAVGREENTYSLEQVISGYKKGKWGNVTIEGGKLDFTGRIYNVDQFTMTGGAITSKVDEDQVILAKDINISGGLWEHTQEEATSLEVIGVYDSITVSGGRLNLLRGEEDSGSCRAFDADKVRIIGGTIQRDESIYIYDALDAYANKLDSFTLENLPENANVKAINGVPAADLTTTSEGKLENIPLPNACNIIELENDENIYRYKYAAETKSMVPDTETKVYDVTLKFTDEDGSTTEKTVKLADGFVIRGQYFDGVDFYECLDANDAVVTDTNPFTIGESNTELTLKKKTAVITVDGKEIEGNVVPEGSIYGILPDNSDKWTDCVSLVYPGDYGIFDGDGHVIKNMECTELYVLPERNYGVIKNVHFNNIRIQEPDSNWSRSGIICGNNYGTIENCSVETCEIETIGENQYGGPTKELVKGLNVYGALAGANFGTIRGCFASGVTFSGEGPSYPIAQDFSQSKLENVYYQAEVESGEIAKTAAQFASGEVCCLLNRGVTDGSQIWYQNIDNDAEKDAVPVPDRSHGTVYSGYQGCIKTYSNTELSDTPSHELDYTVEDNVLTGVCKADPSHTVTITLTAEDATYDGKEHKAVLNKTYSDGWGEADVNAKIVYTKDGEPTTDLTSVGTIKASVTMGDAVIEVTYTIKATPTPTPTATPTASPSATPSMTPAASPSATPAASPSVTPAGTNPGSTPSANPSEGNKATATPAPSDKSVIAPGETKAPADAKAPETAGTKIASKKGDTYKVTDTSGKIPEVELTKSAAKKKAKTVVIPKTVKVDGVNYKVTAIAEKAFAGNKKLKTVVIGADIEKIGAKAFYKCVNLKKVTIQTTKLKAKTVGAKAFAKIHKKAVVKVPKAKKKAYKKWLKKRGIGGKQKIVANV